MDDKLLIDGEQADEEGSVISEATLDELARLSEDVESVGSPEWRAGEGWDDKPEVHKLRLPEAILQAKAKKHAEAKAAVVAAVESGIARKSGADGKR